MFINDAFAQASDAVAATGSISGTLIQLGLIFVIFYILLIRPQQKKMKQHEAMLMAIKKGDKVITGGGIYGTVVKADDSMDLVVQIADGLNVTVNRATIRDVLNQTPVSTVKVETKASKTKSKPANSNAKAKK